MTIAQQVCSNCHGVTGVSISPVFPHLAAQMPMYLASQLRGFKAHNRSDPAGFEYMWGLSRSLTDAQIAGLADYYAHQAPPRGVATRADAARVAAGDKLFHAGVPGKNVPACASCHGDRAQGNEAFPRLAGQHGDYVEKQLAVFQRTSQRPEGAVMTTVAHELTQDDIRNAAAYVESLAAR
jgi:cytochrome c553